VLAELKDQITAAAAGGAVLPDAMTLRQELEEARREETHGDDPHAALTSPIGLITGTIVERAADIEHTQGEQAAHAFAEVAFGRC
jgi:hypothetical protein